MRREDLKTETDIAKSNVIQFFNGTNDPKILYRSVLWGKNDFGIWA